MPQYKEIDGVTYRIVTAKYNGIRLDNCLILESRYQDLKNEKKRRKPCGSKRYMQDRLDDAWKDVVKARDKICQKCGSTTNRLEAHHIFSRSFKSTRWDLDNSILLCSYCHKLGPESAHKSPETFRDWLIPIMGQNKFDKLKWKANSARYKMSLGEMEIWLKKLKSML